MHHRTASLVNRTGDRPRLRGISPTVERSGGTVDLGLRKESQTTDSRSEITIKSDGKYLKFQKKMGKKYREIFLYTLDKVFLTDFSISDYVQN